MPLKKNSSGALLRKDNGALMNDCCCGGSCDLECQIEFANVYPAADPNPFSYQAYLEANRSGYNPVAFMGYGPAFDILSWRGYYSRDILQELYNTYTALNVGDVGVWWFAGRSLMPAGQYNIEYLRGLSWCSNDGYNIGSRFENSFPCGYNLAYENGNISWEYAAIVHSCDNKVLPEYTPIHVETATLDKHALLKADPMSVYEDLYRSQPALTLTITTPSFIGIALRINCSFGGTFNLANDGFYFGTWGSPYDAAHYQPANWPAYKLTKCRSCSPEKISTGVFVNDQTSTDYGKLTWTNTSKCFDRHNIYIKKTPSCDLCSTTDPSVSPDKSYQKDGNTNCGEIAPNEQSLESLEEGSYCVRIDNSIEQYDEIAIYTTSGYQGKRKTATGDVFCITVECPKDIAGNPETPYASLAVASRYIQNGTATPALLTLKNTSQVDVYVNNILRDSMEMPFSKTLATYEIVMPLCTYDCYDYCPNIIRIVARNICYSSTSEYTTSACRQRTPPASCVGSWTTIRGGPILNLSSFANAGAGKSSWRLYETTYNSTVLQGSVSGSTLVGLPATYTPAYNTYYGYFCLAIT